jgi:hypothetical protein
MQPTIHLQNKPGYRCEQYPGLLSKCIVGYIFNSGGLISVVKYPVEDKIKCLLKKRKLMKCRSGK